MERTPPSTYYVVFPYQQQLFNAEKRKNESLAQWAARLTRLGEESGCEDIAFLDKVLRDKFVAGMNPGPMQDFFATTNISGYTFKQVLEVAFTTTAMFEKQEKEKQLKEKQEKEKQKAEQD